MLLQKKSAKSLGAAPTCKIYMAILAPFLLIVWFLWFQYPPFYLDISLVWCIVSFWCAALQVKTLYATDCLGINHTSMFSVFHTISWHYLNNTFMEFLTILHPNIRKLPNAICVIGRILLSLTLRIFLSSGCEIVLKLYIIVILNYLLKN
jgi:hypothetical protein